MQWGFAILQTNQTLHLLSNKGQDNFVEGQNLMTEIRIGKILMNLKCNRCVEVSGS